MSELNQQVNNVSGDRKYFAIVPRLVMALARNPYDIVLWITIKSVAGEGGECYIGTKKLAALSKMSVGQVSSSRKYLVERGLLDGSIRKINGGQTVWHLTVPDLWSANIRWAEQYPKIDDRVAFMEDLKQEQKGETLEESSTHPMGTSASVQGVNTSVHQVNTSVHGVKQRRKEEEPLKPLQNDKPAKVSHSAGQDVKTLVEVFCMVRRCATPQPTSRTEWAAHNKRWKKPLEEILQGCGGDVEKASRLIRECVVDQMEKKFTFDAPDGIIKMARSKMIDMKSDNTEIRGTEDGGGFYV